MKTMRLLTVRDVARLLGCGERTVYNRSRSGALPQPIRVCRQPRWRLSDLAHVIDNAPTGPRTSATKGTITPAEATT